MSCSTTRSSSTGDLADRRFESLAEQYIEELLVISPEYATVLGDHRFDHQLSDYSLAGVHRRRELDASYQKRLADISPSDLNSVNRVDYRILNHYLAYSLFQIDTLREYEWNPMHYNLGSPIYSLIARDFAPLPQRLSSVESRLNALPQIISAAKSNLKNPPRIHTQTAILQNKGSIHLVRDELAALIAEVPSMKASVASAQARALAAMEDFGQWLEKDLLPRSDGDFRLGEEKFRQKLRFSLESDLAKEEILQQARVDLASTQEEMYRVALTLNDSLFPKDQAQADRSDRKKVIARVLAKLADNHPSNETVIDLASQHLKAITEFVRAKGFVSVPDKPVKTIVMPEFRRGVAVAYCDSVGPLERTGETFVVISPTPADWDAKRAESFFREYNNYMVQDLMIHEAVPGHYLQLAHSNQFQAPTRVRTIFRSGLFAEGWAVYAEALMAEHGYGGPEVRLQQLKMRLRMIINAILDSQIHTAGMNEQQAMDLMMNEGFQEEGEAAGKWRRASVSSAQLSTYYVGNLEVQKIRQSYESKHAGKVDYRELHDQMLSFGTPAPKYVKELMGL
jgi:uncharacterized protein (DUF885 family)